MLQPIQQPTDPVSQLQTAIQTLGENQRQGAFLYQKELEDRIVQANGLAQQLAEEVRKTTDVAATQIEVLRVLDQDLASLDKRISGQQATLQGLRGQITEIQKQKAEAAAAAAAAARRIQQVPPNRNQRPDEHGGMCGGSR